MKKNFQSLMRGIGLTFLKTSLSSLMKDSQILKLASAVGLLLCVWLKYMKKMELHMGRKLEKEGPWGPVWNPQGPHMTPRPH